MKPGLSESSIDLHLVELEAEARYARERYRIYRAKAYGPRPTSPPRLRELEKRSNQAAARFDRARGEQELLTARP
jgi:hypothetical protein